MMRGGAMMRCATRIDGGQAMRSRHGGKKFVPMRLVALRCALFVIAGGVACAGPAAAADAAGGDLQAYRHDLALKLQKSPSPRDWALASQLLETRPVTGVSLHERGLILQKAARAAPQDRLVQTLWASIPLQDQRCRAGQRCADQRAALARLEPDNGAAWVLAIGKGDHPGTEAALMHVAGAQRYSEHLGQAIAAWREVFRRYPPPLPEVHPTDGADASTASGDQLDLIFDEAATTAVPATASLFEACRKTSHPNAGAKRFETCGKIARLMMGRSQTLIGRLSGVALLRASHAGSKADIDMVRAVTWQYEQYLKIEPDIDSIAVAKQNYLNLIQTTDSEIQAIQYELRIWGVPLTPPVGWKQTVDGKRVEPLDELPGKAP